MNAKSLLTEQIVRERDFLAEQQVGTEEYNESLKRLISLEEKLAEVEQFESDNVMKEKQMAEEKKDRFNKNCIDIGKFVAGGIIMPIVGLVCITATEKDVTFTGALREYTRYFLPKKWI